MQVTRTIGTLLASIFLLSASGDGNIDLRKATFYAGKGRTITLDSLRRQGFGDYGKYTWARPYLWGVEAIYGTSIADGVATRVRLETIDGIESDKRVQYDIDEVSQVHTIVPKAVSYDGNVPEEAWGKDITWSYEVDDESSVAKFDASTGCMALRDAGLVRIIATDENGEERDKTVVASCELPTRTVTNEAWYVSDLLNSVRKRINDQALQILSSAEHVQDKTTIYNYNGATHTNTYPVYSTFIPPWQQTGSGNVKVFPVSQHILASANHYGNHTRGTQTFTDGVVTNTLTKLPWVNLYTWATNNGFRAEDIGPSGYMLGGWGDISLIPCEKDSEVPDACIPYFMSPYQMAIAFGDDMKGTMAWTTTQEQMYAEPVTLMSKRTATQSSRHARADIRAVLDEKQWCYPIHPGDSGRPVFFMYDGKPVIMFTHFFPCAGPAYTDAYDVLKAFVEAYGDTLKTISF